MTRKSSLLLDSQFNVSAGRDKTYKRGTQTEEFPSLKDKNKIKSKKKTSLMLDDEFGRCEG